MKRSLWAVVIAVPLIALLWYGFGRDPNVVITPIVGKPAPTFALQTLDDQRFSLARLKGHPVILNFWASWCTSCPIDHANLEAAWRSYSGTGVKFVGVSYQDSTSGARSFLREHGGSWPDLRDPAGETAINYGVTGVPETFFIDNKGIVRYHAAGPVSVALLQAQISQLLEKKA